MIIDLTPHMLSVLSGLGDRSSSAHELGVNGCVLKRLWELGFLKMDLERKGCLPPYYSLSQKGEGAAAVLNAKPVFVDREAPIARIQRATARHYRIPVDELLSDRRTQKVARPRQVAMYLAQKLTPKSLSEIGRRFGGRDHTTVIHAIRKVEQLIGDGNAVKDDVKTLMRELLSEQPNIIGDSSHQTAFVGDMASA